MVTVIAHTDGIVEGIEMISVSVGQLVNPVYIFVIDYDCKLLSNKWNMQ